MADDPKKITEFWAWVGVEPNGGEGLLAATFPGLGLTPLVGADRARIESYRQAARQISEHSGYPVKLVCCHQIEVVEDVTQYGEKTSAVRH